MNLYEKIAKIDRLSGSYWIDRISAQIGYAARLSSVNNGKFDEVIEKAADFVLNAQAKDGTITNDAAKQAEEILAPVSETAKKIKVHAVSHAHIDMDWMWGFSETSTITIETFRTMLDLMKEYPEFTFSQSQASTYKIIEEYSPDMLDEIKSRIQEGRWEVSASTWTETDKNMPNGESLSRHILYTKRYLSDLLGLKYEDMQLDFEPDTFGHNISVPEILTRGGVKYYYHCRGFDKHYIYRWRARSGAEVLVYREPKWYNADINYKCFVDLPIFCNDYKVETALKVYGVGDHGGGPTRRDIEHLLDMQTWPVMPSIEFSTYHKFFKELENYKDNLAIVEEELNFVFTGCYTSQSRIKMANRIAEARLFEAETISTAANILGGSDYGVQFGKAWENVLYNHFHDIIPGSGVTETREHALGLFQKSLAYAYANSSNALRYLAANIDTSKAKDLYSSGTDIKESVSEGAGVGFAVADNTGSVFSYFMPRTERGAGDARIFHLVNPTQYRRNEVTVITIWDWQHPPHRAVFTDTDGNVIKSQFLQRGSYWTHNYFVYAIMCDIEPFSYKTYILDEEKSRGYNFASTPDPRIEAVKDNNIILENDLVRAEFDRRTLKLISYKDKTNDRQLIDAPSAYFRFINEDHRSSAWVIGSYMKIVDLHEEYNVRLVDSNIGGIAKRFTYEIEFLASRLKVVVALKENSRTLEFMTEIDWREQSNSRVTPQIGFYAPLGYAVSKYRYDIPFGTIDRDGVNDDRPANSFVAGIPENRNFGAIAVMSNTRYGYRCNNNSIYLNLLHTSTHPDAHPETDTHTINIGLLASPDCENGTFYKEASAFVHPVSYVTNKPHGGKLPYSSGTLFTVDSDVKISAVKTPEEAGEKNKEIIIIRLYDISGKDGKVKLNFMKDVKSASSLDMTEMPLQPSLSAASGFALEGKSVSFDLIKYGVATIKIQL